MRGTSLVLFLAGVSAAGCRTNAVHGRVDGFRIPIRSSFLIYQPPNGDTDGTTIVTMSDLPSACAVYRFWFEQKQSAESPEEMAEAWDAAFPDQFWEVIVEVFNDGTTWPISNTQWQGLGWDEAVTTGRLRATLVQHNALRPAEWFDGLVGFENHYFSNAGFVKWRSGEPGVRLSGVFETSLVDVEGVPAGPVKIEFNATPCSDELDGTAVLPYPPDPDGGPTTTTTDDTGFD
jgi:hypothetical protein